VKRKPTSYRDFLMTVARVRHPDLEDVHHRWLQDLALYASQTGEHAYPGYDALTEMTGRQFDRQRIYSNHCVELGLIEITHQGRGKGVANEYRFCLENAAYPEDYEGRARDETASVGKRDNANQKRLSRQAVSEEKSTSNDRENHLPVQDSRLSDLSKPLGGGSIHPSLHQQPQQQLDPKRAWKNHTRASDIEEAIDAIDAEMQKTEGKEIINKTREQTQHLAEIIIAYGSSLTKIVWRSYLQDRDTKQTWPYVKFTEDFKSLLRAAEAKDAFAQKIWKVRQELSFVHLGDVGRARCWGFDECLTDKEKAILEEHQAYMISHRDDPEGQLTNMPLNHAGELFYIQRRARKWLKENQELVEQREQAQQQEMEADISEKEEARES
jgi:hypothetical protein